MGILVHSLLWVMQDLNHQPYESNTTVTQTSRTLNDGIPQR